MTLDLDVISTELSLIQSELLDNRSAHQAATVWQARLILDAVHRNGAAPASLPATITDRVYAVGTTADLGAIVPVKVFITLDDASLHADQLKARVADVAALSGDSHRITTYWLEAPMNMPLGIHLDMFAEEAIERFDAATDMERQSLWVGQISSVSIS